MNAMSDHDVRSFRETLSCFPTGVAIVTAKGADQAPVGLTISSFNSVSMSPPLVLWSLALKSASLAAFRASRGFVINVLAADQDSLAGVFSTPVDDRFCHGHWVEGPEGHPMLEEAAAVLSCRSYAHYDGGDHEIVVGEVIWHEASDRVPLVYGKGRLAPLAVNGS
ncbi:MAG: flavin reductase family protein [Silicimonas sp.]|nr:flavin reductase family protein [Silicimonas sp.]